MTKHLFRSITLISSPYHVGLRHIAVGNGPAWLKQRGMLEATRRIGMAVEEIEIPPVADTFDGEIGRSFEIMRRTSSLVSEAHDRRSFPVVLAGNCNVGVGVASGLTASTRQLRKKLACVWFDAHDDFNTPDTMVSGYLDSMGIAMMGGLCFRSMLSSVPGFERLDLRRLIHVGMRDVNEIERCHVEDSDLSVVWGSEETHVDFDKGLDDFITQKDLVSEPTYVHLDVDCLDTSIGKANKFAAPGGLGEDDLLRSMRRVAADTMPLALTVASFDPSFEGADNIADVAVRGVTVFLESLQAKGAFDMEEVTQR